MDRWRVGLTDSGDVLHSKHQSEMELLPPPAPVGRRPPALLIAAGAYRQDNKGETCIASRDRLYSSYQMWAMVRGISTKTGSGSKKQ